MADASNHDPLFEVYPPDSGETIHQCPPASGGGVMPCCGKTPFEVPRTDRIAMDRGLVTCCTSPLTAKAED